MSAARLAEFSQFVAFDRLRPDDAGARKATASNRVGRNTGHDARDSVVLLQGDNTHVDISPKF